ncbi:4530_t:CDS:2 [Funneliformis mosseae]|uniref:4530_t:CDS:1 n=1 Tax=Funneliformis mosseae TaxID=27381 RepID=A0A9N9AXV0_FUNMO|nr:4530_t:CDS:2 [Funneliformis mosseae]
MKQETKFIFGYNHLPKLFNLNTNLNSSCQALHVFMLVIAIFLFVEALPHVRSKLFTLGDDQNFDVLFDTDSFVVSIDCLTPIRTEKNQYDSRKDNLFEDLGRNFQVNYVQKGNHARPLSTFSLLTLNDNAKSELTIGGTNPERYIEPITWINLVDNNQGFGENFFVNGQPLNFPNCEGTVDTATSLKIMPPADARQIYEAIPNLEFTSEMGASLYFVK